MPIGAFKLNAISRALSAAPTYISASGGTIAYINSSGVGYKVHSFTTAGTNTFTVSTGGNNLQAIIVGGGGGSGGLSSAGTSQASGGGGGGQYQLQTGITVTAQNYSIVSGAAGSAGGNGTNGGFGSSSSAFGFTSAGGAGSQGTNGSTPSSAGNAGGSGGCAFPGGVATNGTAGTLAGGNALNGQTGSTIAAGGGGSNVSAGSSGVSGGVGANGAAGTQTYFNGSNLVLGGGGGGAGPSGSGSNSNGMTATARYGEGATGVFTNSGVVLGSAGTAGAVLIRYPMSTTFDVSFNTSVTATTSTITIPATAAVNDYVFLIDWAGNTTSTIPTSVTPTGFTSIDGGSQGTSPGCRMNVSYKKLVSGDPGSTITGMNAAINRKILLVYRPNMTVNTFTPTSLGVNVSSSTPSSIQLSSASGEYTINVAVYGAFTAQSIAARTSTLTATREITNATNFGCLYVKTFEFSEGSSASNSISMSDNGSNGLAGFSFKFK